MNGILQYINNLLPDTTSYYRRLTEINNNECLLYQLPEESITYFCEFLDKAALMQLQLASKKIGRCATEVLHQKYPVHETFIMTVDKQIISMTILDNGHIAFACKKNWRMPYSVYYKKNSITPRILKRVTENNPFALGVYELCIYDHKSVQCIQTYKYPIVKLAVLPNGDLIGGTYHSSIKIWKKNDFTCRKIINGTDEYNQKLLHLRNFFVNLDMTITCIYYDETIGENKICVRDTDTGLVLHAITVGDGYPYEVIGLQNGNIVVGYHGGSVRIYAKTGSLLKDIPATILTHGTGIQYIEIGVHNNDIFTLTNFNILSVWCADNDYDETHIMDDVTYFSIDTASKNLVCATVNPKYKILNDWSNNDSNKKLTEARDNIIKFYDPETMKCTKTLGTHHIDGSSEYTYTKIVQAKNNTVVSVIANHNSSSPSHILIWGSQHRPNYTLYKD